MSKKSIRQSIFTISILILTAAEMAAQSGDNFTITQAVVAGGGEQSTGGTFSLDGTNGQAVSGNSSSGEPFTVTSGFWNFAPFAPTAASVSVSGRVITANGRGIRNVLITIISPNGETRTILTSAFGYFRFSEVEVGETYIIRVAAKRFTFSQPTQICSVFEEITDLNFVADPFE